MINGKSVLAVIPARGGSRRLPKKNVLPLAGKPLIIWSIEAGLSSKCIDKVIVSSDDKEILNISQKAGADTVMRPAELATDEASSYSAMEHVIKTIDKDFDLTIMLQPTSPLRNGKHIDEAFKFLVQRKADAVISVCKAEHSPLWANTLPVDGSMEHFLKDEIKGLRSQDLPVYYRLNGAIYICSTDRFIEEKTFFISNGIFAYRMNHRHSVDIDTITDFQLVEVMLHTDNFSTNNYGL